VAAWCVPCNLAASITPTQLPRLVPPWTRATDRGARMEFLERTPGTRMLCRSTTRCPVCAAGPLSHPRFSHPWHPSLRRNRW
jgi:hypothetical protein